METQANVFYKYKNGVSMRISIGKLINLHLFHSPELEKKNGLHSELCKASRS